ncbi:MAG TPA: MFS transporter [Caulobacteraceae bacterium]|nr:MFS transporter [Caulobacteraceae bacterium]
MSSNSAIVGDPGAKGAPLPTIFAFGSLGVPLAGILLIFGVYLPRYYVGLGVSFVAASGAIFAVRMIDMWLDLAVGFAMDRTKSPLGRYRLWTIIGVPLLMLGVWKLLMPQGEVSAGYMILWLLVAYAGNSMVSLGLAAWSAVIATSYHDRSRVFGWTQAMAVVGSVALLLLPRVTHGQIVLGKGSSMPMIGTILLVALPAAMLVCTLFTPERLAVTQRQRFTLGDYWTAVRRPTVARIVLADLALTLGPGTTAPLYVFFFHDAKGFSVADVSFLLIFYIGAGLIGAPVWARVARRFGKHRTVQIACVLYAIAQTVLMALPRVHDPYVFEQMIPTLIGMFSVGFIASSFVLLVRAMVADIVDEVRLETGQDLTSLLFSLVTTTTKIGGTITVAIVFPVLQLVGYNGKEGAANTPQAVFGLEMCYLFAPIILVFGGGLALLGYKLDASRHAQIRAELEERERASVAAAEETLTGPVVNPAQ